ncbi:hypothetical protein [Lysinibacillus fusiformis]|uniref:hypothetical protein n=1 Tax=Lysinibacillus fusiformis TaxID=28031 RepID=UPI0023A9F081|nr:hypothetical protein [Lysinibacillus fusiformis]WEA39066.1 hypothetical protein PWJ66_21090 [Lysinibacillus fusiformis]
MVDHEKQDSSVIQQLLKDQLNRRNVQDNSFAFLEKNTLQQLIAYLVSGEKSKNFEQRDHPELQTKWLKQLDEVLEDSKAQFEEVIEILKSFSG